MEQIHCDQLKGEVMASPEPYFVDFLREAPEPTGDEPEDADMEAPKVYEMVSVCLHSTGLNYDLNVNRCQVWNYSQRN